VHWDSVFQKAATTKAMRRRGYALRSDDSIIASFFLSEPMTFLGEISFSIYLVHYLVISVIGTVLKVALHAKPISIAGWDGPMFDISPVLGDVLVVATISCTLVIAKFTYERIEEPGRRFGYRLAGGKDVDRLADIGTVSRRGKPALPAEWP
jgi:peptidoglycan/LPS O-acetylase OafA/YrhL